MKKIKILIFIILFFFLSILIFIYNIADIHGVKEHVTFTNGKDLLSAYYLTPENKKIKGVVIFVHGDGDINYDAYGYYDLIWQKILDSGYAIFSWDKPGVGDSSGNWLLQSMKDRQNEVRSAISFLKNKYHYKAGQIGLMGFSQAGWVIPAVAKNNKDIGFMIGVGFAIDWMEQSWYMTKERLIKQNATKQKIHFYYIQHLKEISFWENNPSYVKYKKLYAQYDGKLSQERFNFVKKNALVNSKKDFEKITQPTLILLGEKDQNVNTKNTQKVLRNISKDKTNFDIQMIRHATHALLKYPQYDVKSPGVFYLIRLLWQGENAYATPFLNLLQDWLNKLQLRHF